MVDNIITKPLGLVLIVTANMVFNGPSHAAVIGILGSNISLLFTFNNNITKGTYFSVYTTGDTKIADQKNCKACFDIYPDNSSVFYHIANLNVNHSKTYWVSFISPSEVPIKSHTMELIVHKDNRSTTVAPTSNPAISQTTGNSSSFHIITVLVVSPLVLCAAILPVFIYYLIKTKDKQQPPQQGSNSTVQETIEESSQVVYSILDFPKRPPAAVVELNPSDTEYAAVSYLTEYKRK